MMWIGFLVCLLLPVEQPDYNNFFTDRTFRFDYYHSGTAKEEHISLEEIRLESKWPGSKRNLVDGTNLGKYLFEVYDVASEKLIYSQGFASIYGEWETTGEAIEGKWRTFHESQRFPEPRHKFRLVLKKRNEAGEFATEIFKMDFDPKSRFVNRGPLVKQGNVWKLFENGASDEKVDILILSEGYTLKEKEKFHKDALRLTNALFKTEPFKARKSDFNVWAIDLPSQSSGISNPRKNIWKKSPLGLSFNSFDSDRYVLTYENKALREVAAQAPYDAVIIVFNDMKYGGGGIFNLWATVSSDTEPSEYIFIHEFGHSFAGLADEYYSSPVSYEEFVAPGTEPWEPNITALLNPGNLKWKEFVDRDTPLPTPWDKNAYDSMESSFQTSRSQMVSTGSSEQSMESLFREVKERSTAVLHSQKYYGKVGAFEGAGYQSKGLYRPELDCIMFTRNEVPFCRPCHKAINGVIDRYVK